MSSGASKSVPRIVPWLNATEWRNTRRLLFSNNIEDIRLGILQAKIWMDRGKVPTAVESTVNFLETILVDTEYCDEFLKGRANFNDEDRNFEEENVNETSNTDAELNKTIEGLEPNFERGPDDRVLRLSYNAAIIRFVNELVDRAQKSLFATSITKLADQIGLPRVFVDIRHDGTHDKMNSLELLRWASSEALKWLEDQYWSYEDDMTPASLIKDFNSNVYGLLDQFLEQLEKINEKQSTSALEKSSNSRIVSQIDFLQTLPRVMKCFLISLCDYNNNKKNITNIIEAIIRPFIRNNWEIFSPSFIDILLERKECISWIPWINEELKKSSMFFERKKFISRLFVEFSKRSSSELFNEKIVKIWEIFGETDSKLNKIYLTFESIYLKKTKSQSLLKISESKNFILKRKYVESDNLDGWSEINENWRPCPLGSIPK